MLGYGMFEALDYGEHQLYSRDLLLNGINYDTEYCDVLKAIAIQHQLPLCYLPRKGQTFTKFSISLKTQQNFNNLYLVYLGEKVLVRGN